MAAWTPQSLHETRGDSGRRIVDHCAEIAVVEGIDQRLNHLADFGEVLHHAALVQLTANCGLQSVSCAWRRRAANHSGRPARTRCPSTLAARA